MKRIDYDRVSVESDSMSVRARHELADPPPLILPQRCASLRAGEGKRLAVAVGKGKRLAGVVVVAVGVAVAVAFAGAVGRCSRGKGVPAAVVGAV
jgi:hypothetical protein